MKDAGFALATAYISLLQGLTYKNNAVTLYSLQAPDDATAPYVVLGPWTPQSANTKDSFMQEGEINLDVVTRFSGNTFSKKPAADIADQITQRLKPTPYAEVLELVGFKSWNTVIVGAPEIEAPTASDKVYRKVITVSHSLQQL